MKKLIAVSAAIFAAGAFLHTSTAAADKISVSDFFDCVKTIPTSSLSGAERSLLAELAREHDDTDGCALSESLKKLLSELLSGFEEPKADDSDTPEDSENSEDSEKPDSSDTPALPDRPSTPEEAPPTVDIDTPEEPDASDDTVSYGSYAEAVLTLVNRYRAENGLSALTLDKSLCKAAETRAREIVSTFSHTRPNGTSCFTVLSESGISYGSVGENIAYGQDSAAEVMSAWMNSSGHRANILSSSFAKLGVGVYQSGGTLYWAQLFTD